MMMPRLISGFLVMSLLLALACIIPPAAAQEVPPPPEPGAVISSYAPPTAELFPAPDCPTGRNAGRAEPAGYRLSVTGPCSQDDPFIYVAAPAIQLKESDVQVEVTFPSGIQRAHFYLQRLLPGGGYVAAVWRPASGFARLVKARGPATTVLAERTDLERTTAPDLSHTLSLRVRGTTFWMLIDGQPIVSASDEDTDTVGLGLALLRLGPAADADETSVVARSLRVSSLSQDAQPARPPAAAPAPPAAPAIAAPAVPTAPAQLPGRPAAAPAQVPAAR